MRKMENEPIPCSRTIMYPCGIKRGRVSLHYVEDWQRHATHLLNTLDMMLQLDRNPAPRESLLRVAIKEPIKMPPVTSKSEGERGMTEESEQPDSLNQTLIKTRQYLPRNIIQRDLCELHQIGIMASRVIAEEIV
jgi:hypothetical protein